MRFAVGYLAPLMPAHVAARQLVANVLIDLTVDTLRYFEQLTVLLMVNADLKQLVLRC